MGLPKKFSKTSKYWEICLTEVHGSYTVSCFDIILDKKMHSTYTVENTIKILKIQAKKKSIKKTLDVFQRVATIN